MGWSMIEYIFSSSTDTFTKLVSTRSWLTLKQKWCRTILRVTLFLIVFTKARHVINCNCIICNMSTPFGPTIACCVAKSWTVHQNWHFTWIVTRLEESRPIAPRRSQLAPTSKSTQRAKSKLPHPHQSELPSPKSTLLTSVNSAERWSKPGWNFGSIQWNTRLLGMLVLEFSSASTRDASRLSPRPLSSGSTLSCTGRKSASLACDVPKYNEFCMTSQCTQKVSSAHRGLMCGRQTVTSHFCVTYFTHIHMQHKFLTVLFVWFWDVSSNKVHLGP